MGGPIFLGQTPLIANRLFPEPALIVSAANCSPFTNCIQVVVAPAVFGEQTGKALAVFYSLSPRSFGHPRRLPPPGSRSPQVSGGFPSRSALPRPVTFRPPLVLQALLVVSRVVLTSSNLIHLSLVLMEGRKDQSSE